MTTTDRLCFPITDSIDHCVLLSVSLCCPCYLTRSFLRFLCACLLFPYSGQALDSGLHTGNTGQERQISMFSCVSYGNTGLRGSGSPYPGFVAVRPNHFGSEIMIIAASLHTPPSAAPLPSHRGLPCTYLCAVISRLGTAACTHQWNCFCLLLHQKLFSTAVELPAHME